MVKDAVLDRIRTAGAHAGYPHAHIALTRCAKDSFGDFSTTVSLGIAKEQKKNPMDVAHEITRFLKPDEIVGRIDIAPPGFINIHVTDACMLHEMARVDETYGNSSALASRRVIVEFSSPNIAKPFTIGHLRSTIIGDAIANLFTSQGATVFRDNHLGDWGTQFGKQIYAIKTFSIQDDIPPSENERLLDHSENPVKLLVALYVKFHEEAEKDPSLEDAGRMWFKRLEDGDSEARRLWKKCIDWSFKEFDRIYARLGVVFTENDGRGFGESFFEDKMEIVIQELRQKDLLRESKGAQLVFFPEDALPPLMIKKQDGATLYATRDLATDRYRLNNPRYGTDVQIINEVGAEQALYFRQIFEVERMLGWVTEGQRVHVKHGMYRFHEGKMSTRKGNTIWLEDVLQEAEKRARALGESADGTRTSDIASAVGIGAIKWNDLKRSSHLDVVFDWDEILNLQGNASPYIQYTYVRCRSVLKKSGGEELPKLMPIALQEHAEEKHLMRHLMHYPDVVTSAALSYAPNTIAGYLYELAQRYNAFYQTCPIMKEENRDLRSLRLMITEKVGHVIKHGLGLLGIQTVEHM